jgi:organic radical activating enzyme
MKIYSLTIEVTRRCNMSCYHCLRGCAQNKDLKKEDLKSLLNQVESISNVAFSGGEPSLNVEAINDFIELVKERNIVVNSFYIATNGKRISKEFIIACLELYCLCEEKEQCQVSLSTDMFHRQEDYITLDDSLLSGLSFVSVQDEYKYRDFLKEGNLKDDDTFGTREVVQDSLEIDLDYETIEEGTIYLNCEGEIILGCDWSFENQKNHKICDVNDKIFSKCVEFKEKLDSNP